MVDLAKNQVSLRYYSSLLNFVFNFYFGHVVIIIQYLTCTTFVPLNFRVVLKRVFY